MTGWTGQVVVTGWTDDWLGLVGLVGGGVHLLLPRAGPGLTARSCLIFMVVVKNCRWSWADRSAGCFAGLEGCRWSWNWLVVVVFVCCCRVPPGLTARSCLIFMVVVKIVVGLVLVLTFCLGTCRCLLLPRDSVWPLQGGCGCVVRSTGLPATVITGYRPLTAAG